MSLYCVIPQTSTSRRYPPKMTRSKERARSIILFAMVFCLFVCYTHVHHTFFYFYSKHMRTHICTYTHQRVVIRRVAPLAPTQLGTIHNSLQLIITRYVIQCTSIVDCTVHVHVSLVVDSTHIRILHSHNTLFSVIHKVMKNSRNSQHPPRVHHATAPPRESHSRGGQPLYGFQ